MSKKDSKKDLGFTQTPIPLCGGEYNFKRCSNETITSFDKRIDEEIEKFESTQLEANSLNDMTEDIQEEIDSIKRKLKLLSQKSEMTDEDINKAMEFEDKLDELRKELKTHREKIMEFNKTAKEKGTKLGDAINEIIAEKVATMLDGITAKQFLKEYDPIDMHIAGNLAKYYEMCMIGERPSKVKQEIKEDIEEFRKQQKEQ